VSRYNIHGIAFRDPNLTFDKKRARSFSELLLRYNLDIRWVWRRVPTGSIRNDRSVVPLGLRSIEVG